MHRRLALLGATFAFAVPVGITAAPAFAASYPDKVKSEYLKGCKQGAKKDGASARDARVFCKTSLKCLQRELTLKEFGQYGKAVAKGDKTPPHNRVVKRCVKEAAKAL
jgi:hypothetical protein